MRFMFNEDPNHFIYSRKTAGETVTEKELRAFIRQYEGTNITDFLFNVNARVSAVPSKVFDSVLDQYETAKKENRTSEHLGGIDIAYDLFEKQAIDMYAVWFEETRAIGMRPWLSFRMNDIHSSFSEDMTLQSAYYLAHPEYRRAAYRRCVSASDCAYDYAHEAVRARMLAYIEEMAERYDADGFEIDWMREPTCFAPGREDGAVLTAFMEKVSAIRKRAEEKYGHKILISVTVPPHPETARKMGFFVSEWARNGLCEIVVPIGRWASTTNDISASMWKEWMYPASPEVIPGHQILIRSTFSAPVQIQTFETSVGAAAAFYGDGADGTYLYNFMDRIGSFLCEGTGLKTDLDNPVRLGELLCTLGDREKVEHSVRRHIYTLTDVRGEWDRHPSDLPIRVQQNDYYFNVRIPVGYVPEERTVYVILAIKPEEADFQPTDIEVWLSGRKCSFETFCDIETHCSVNRGYMFRVDDGAPLGIVGMIEFTSPNLKVFTVDYAEIYVHQ